MNILFITSTYLGDAIISSGILSELVKQYPNSNFTIACGSIPAPLFEQVPLLKRLIIIQKKSFSLHWVKLWFQTFFMVWDIVVDVRGTGLSYFLITKKRYIWKATQESDLRVHQLARFMGLKKTPYNKIWIGKKHSQDAEILLPKGPSYIALSPTANWDKKCWPLDYYIELAYKLLKNTSLFPQAKIVVFGTLSQRASMDPLFESLSPDKVIDLMGKVDLVTVAACLERCKIFVGNDSGLMHLAAAVSIPTLGLFGPSPAEIYAPWGPKTALLRVNLPLSHIMDRVNQGEFIMKELPVDQVEDSTKNLMKKFK